MSSQTVQVKTHPTGPKSCFTIDLDKANAFLETVREDPTKGRFTFKTTTVWQGGAVSKTTARNFEIYTDDPKELGGTDSAPDPVELLLAALGTCLSIGYATNAAQAGFDLEDLEIEVEGDIDLRGYFNLDKQVRPGFDQMRVNVKVKSDATDEQLEKLRNLVERTSPMFDNVSNGVPVKTTFQRMAG